MIARSYGERERDVTLIADAVTAALKAALPGIVRKEVETQLAWHADERADPDESPNDGAAKSSLAPATRVTSRGGVVRKTHVDGLVSVGAPQTGKKP